MALMKAELEERAKGEPDAVLKLWTHDSRRMVQRVASAEIRRREKIGAHSCLRCGRVGVRQIVWSIFKGERGWYCSNRSACAKRAARKERP